MKYIFTGLFIILSLSLFAQEKFQLNWQSLDSRPMPAWFEDAKFGIFIHWGLYSVPAWGPTNRDFEVSAKDDWQKRVAFKYAEHYWNHIRSKKPVNGFASSVYPDHHKKIYGDDFQYQDFLKDFKAEYFKPDDWAEMIKNSGAKYVVLTSKHHEGFALWPSAYSWNWNAYDVGPHRDLLGDVTKAIKAKDLKMGYYYSLLEWFHPLYKKETIDAYVDQHMIPQMKELVTTYKPDILWGDGQWNYPSATWKMPEFISWLYNRSPVKDSIVINDRWGNETWGSHGGYLTVEYGNLNDGKSDLITAKKPWEECKGIGGSFGYNKNENLEDYATSEQLVHDLIVKVSKGGNLLLNIGPTADGLIPVIMQQRLADIGLWLKLNGDAIYGTRKVDNGKISSKHAGVYFTQKGKDIYVITTSFPAKEIEIENINKPVSIKLFGYKGSIKASNKNGKLIIPIPNISLYENMGNYAWVFKLESVR